MKLSKENYKTLFDKLYLMYSYGRISFTKFVRRLQILNRYSMFIIILLLCSNLYAEVGTASYYNTASCQREGTSGVLTASGERFYDNGMTCARRSREFGIYYKVTNIDNGKSVIVKHNDFGPNKKLAKKGRIIDLSEGAFKKIANTDEGIINVRVERSEK